MGAPNGGGIVPSRFGAAAYRSLPSSDTASWRRPYVALSNLLWRIVDQTIIDGAVNGVATAVVVNGQLWRYVQDGNVQHYALVFLGGAIALLSYYLVR